MKSGINAACTDGNKHLNSLIYKSIKKQKTMMSSQLFVNFVKKIFKLLEFIKIIYKAKNI